MTSCYPEFFAQTYPGRLVNDPFQLNPFQLESKSVSDTFDSKIYSASFVCLPRRKREIPLFFFSFKRLGVRPQ